MTNESNFLSAILQSPLSPTTWFRRLCQTALDAQERRVEKRNIDETVRQLSALDDETLKDLGLSRDRIRSAVIDRAAAERRERFGW